MDTVQNALADGTMAIEGRMPYSSNATFLVSIGAVHGIYKPERGERPLWDFPSGLHRREIAAYELSQWLGWDLVPLTIGRDGPLGYGSVQLFVESDPDHHYFTIRDQCPELHDRLRDIALFDIVANNTDRKGGHCLLGADGVVHAIDHGLCFAAEPKLRTVIWDFGGEPIDDARLADIARLAEQVPLRVAALLDDDEVAAIARRARRLLATAVFPVDRSGRSYPWPLV